MILIRSIVIFAVSLFVFLMAGLSYLSNDGAWGFMGLILYMLMGTAMILWVVWDEFLTHGQKAILLNWVGRKAESMAQLLRHISNAAHYKAIRHQEMAQLEDQQVK